MWAQVKDGSVEKIIAHPKSMVDENGVQHPRSIFSMWTKEEKIAIGIYDVIMAPKYRDAVRVKAEEMEEAITKATTMEAFKKLSITTHTKAGKVKDLAILQDWPQLGE